LIGLALWLISCCLVVIALARPIWGTEVEVVEYQNLSVMLVLDVSTSMDSQDILPSRLERAKTALQELIQVLDGNEVGLVLFAGESLVQVPLTTDTRSVLDFVKHASTQSVVPQGTNIASALNLALLASNAASTDQHVIVLLTDGESHDGDLSPIIDRLIQSSTSVHAIGYGEVSGVPIPVRNPDGSIIDKADSAGNPVVSALDETTLQQIAFSTGGTYQHAAGVDNEVASVQQALEQYLSPTITRGVQSRPIERFDIFIAIALLLLAIETVISTRHLYAA